MKYLLDTNVISEIWKPNPDPKVTNWLRENMTDSQIAAPAVAEIADGAEAAQGRRRVDLLANLDELLQEHGDSVAPFDTAAAIEWGQAQHSSEIKRQPQSLFDSLIESIAKARGLAVVTRNTGDFRRVNTVNPWL